MKKIVSLILIFVFAFTAFSCKKEETKQLDMPENVSVSESGLISWDEVDNATGYVVSIDEDTYPVTVNNYQVQSLENDFIYSVWATAEGYKDSLHTEPKKFEASIIPVPPQNNIKVAIDCDDEVMSGKTYKLKKVITGTVNKSATWEILEGGDIATIDQNTGSLKISSVTNDGKIKVRCTSKENPNCYGEKVIIVRAKMELTQEMLDALKNPKLVFDGYMNIELYNLSSSISQELEGTFVTTFKTIMDGDRWYAEYERSDSIQKGKIYYKNYNNMANQIGVNFNNGEEYTPMLDDDEKEVTWEDSGLYNNFSSLKVEDFKFNEETWSYEYKRKSADDKLISKMVSSSNPYEFEPETLSLLIEEGEILGITSKSTSSYGVQPGYRAEQTMYAAITTGDEIVVPLREKYATKDYHTMLNQALNNMRNLDSYTINFTQSIMNLQTNIDEKKGFTETITKDMCFFQPYDLINLEGGKTEKKYQENSEYGYKKISDTLYNSFYRDNKTAAYEASRGFEGGFKEAKPSFDFAGEIFTMHNEGKDGAHIYFVDNKMLPVASMFYHGVGNDLNLYGIYANEGYLGDNVYFTPFLIVNEVEGKPYITSSCFYFNLGILRGVVEIEYSNFGKATLPEGTNVEFKTKQIPNSWDGFKFIVTPEFNVINPNAKEDEEIESVQFFKEFLNFTDDTQVKDNIPFFGEVLGDTFGLGITTLQFDSKHSPKKTIMLYYDVALDIDYSINSSLKKVENYLLGKGFKKNKAGEFFNEFIVIKPVDDALDLKIYIWKR